MWKTILVEDEPHAMDLLKHLIAWEQYGYRIVGDYPNGQEALEGVGLLQPDLIITDIMMPVMDGLELMIRVREMDFDCKFVMLTCMSDFEYARQALEYGATSYMLKLSLEPRGLVKTLAKVTRELAAREKIRRLETLTDNRAAEFPDMQRSTGHDAINKIIEYLSEHYHEEISLTSMASLAAMDPSYVSDLFKKKTGHTLIHFVQKVRVEASIRYLLDSNLSISRIADQCGFASDNYFIKVFKRWTGKTPSEFRHKP